MNSEPAKTRAQTTLASSSIRWLKEGTTADVKWRLPLPGFKTDLGMLPLLHFRDESPNPRYESWLNEIKKNAARLLAFQPDE